MDWWPNFYTIPGNVTEVSPVHPLNDLAPIDSIPSGKVIEVRFVKELNASLPIVVNHSNIKRL